MFCFEKICIITYSFPDFIKNSPLFYLDNLVVNLEVTATVRTVDYHGKPRTSGGDPITARLNRKEATESTPVPVEVEDLDDGSYTVKFRPQTVGWFVIFFPLLYLI